MTPTSCDTRNSRDTIPIPENEFMSRNSDSRPIGNFGYLRPLRDPDRIDMDGNDILDLRRVSAGQYDGDRDPEFPGLRDDDPVPLLQTVQRQVEAACWSKVDDTAHQPNEYCVIDNMIDDAKVYAHIFLQH